MGELLAVRDLAVAYGGGAVHAVDGVSFEVRKGETLGIVGESGCGKSTLARLLTRLIVPDSGEQIFDGEEVAAPRGISVAAMRKQVQMVFQDSASSLNPRMPIQGSVAFGPIAHGVPKEEALSLARELLLKVGLNPALFGPRYPHELSGGQKQRVNIARALALRPRMVILDEAVSALDKSVEAQVLNLLRTLKRELSLTYIFISHDLSVVRWISDRVLVMRHGRLVESGTAEGVFGAPQHAYTKMLLAAVPRESVRAVDGDAELVRLLMHVGDEAQECGALLQECHRQTRQLVSLCEHRHRELASYAEAAERRVRVPRGDDAVWDEAPIYACLESVSSGL